MRHDEIGIVVKTDDEDLLYWKTRCKLAEKYIEESPCDPDIYKEQLKAYWQWMDFKKEKL